MSHNERAIVHTFEATAPTPRAAIDAAAAQLQAWYADQRALYSVDGASLFHYGTWLFQMPHGGYHYIITVLDTRRSEYQR